MEYRPQALPTTFNYFTTSDRATPKYKGNCIVRKHSMSFTKTEETLFKKETMGNQPDEDIPITADIFDDENFVTTNQSDYNLFEPIDLANVNDSHDASFYGNEIHHSLYDLQEPHHGSDVAPATCANAVQVTNSFVSNHANNQAWSTQSDEYGRNYSNRDDSEKVSGTIQIPFHEQPLLVKDDGSMVNIKQEYDQVSKYAEFLQGLMSTATNNSSINAVDCIRSCNSGYDVAEKNNVTSLEVQYQDTHQHSETPSNEEKKSNTKTTTKRPSLVARVVTEVVNSVEDTSKKLPPPPLRALSAYNFFFHDERERLLNDVKEMDLSPARAGALLLHHWNRDRSQKRIHRKTHGKFPFAELSKMISKRWKELDAVEKQFYEQISAKDWDRYQRESDERKQREKMIKKAQREAIRKLKRKAATTKNMKNKKQKTSLHPSVSVVSL